MKKVMLAVIFSFALAGMASASTSTWQIYNPTTKTLQVFSGETNLSGQCWMGLAENYNGFCTNPSAPSTAYEFKQRILAQANQLEQSNPTAAQALRERWGF